jgi:hypothetical protein
MSAPESDFETTPQNSATTEPAAAVQPDAQAAAAGQPDAQVGTPATGVAPVPSPNSHSAAAAVAIIVGAVLVVWLAFSAGWISHGLALRVQEHRFAAGYARQFDGQGGYGRMQGRGGWGGGRCGYGRTQDQTDGSFGNPHGDGLNGQPGWVPVPGGQGTTPTY